MTYLEKVPQPFRDDLLTGQVIPFVGAGLSQNTHPPQPAFNTIGAELARQIPEDTYKQNPLDAVAAYQQAFSRSQLIEELAKILNPPNSVPSETILAFARLPFEQVATTNFDFLLEKAYAMLEIPVNPQVTQAQLSVTTAFDGEKLFKFHGDFNHPEDIIVTEEDYDAFSTRFSLKATYLAYLLTAYTPFYVGYSLDDYDFRTILRFVGEQLHGFQRLGYTVQVGASAETILRFRRRNVYVINYEGNPSTDFPKILTGLFKEMLDYWLEHLLDSLIITDKPFADVISATAATPQSLCFLAIPPNLIALYKEKLTPTILEKRYIPCSISNIYSHCHSDLAFIQALAKRSNKIITLSSYSLSKMLRAIYPTQKLYLLDYSPSHSLKISTKESSILKSIGKWLEQK